MAQLLSDPFMHGKASAFPNSYRPKTLEERIRRSHVKTLEHQMDSLPRSSKSIASMIKASMKASPPPMEANISTPTLTMENLQAMAPVEVTSKADDSTIKSAEKAASAILDKISDQGDSNRASKKKTQYLMQSFASVSDDEESGKHNGSSAKSMQYYSRKEDGLLSIINPLDTQNSNRKLTAEEAEELSQRRTETGDASNRSTLGNMEDLHGPLGFLSSNVIKMRSASYHGHVNSDEERDALVTPYMSGKFQPSGSTTNGSDDVEEVGFETGAPTPGVEEFGVPIVVDENDAITSAGGVATVDGKHGTHPAVHSIKTETPVSISTSDSPNIDSSPMGGASMEKSVTFSNSDRSINVGESPKAVNGATTSQKLTHVVSMSSIKEEPSELAAAGGAAGAGGTSVKNSMSFSTKLDSVDGTPAPSSKTLGALEVDVSSETLAESELTPLPSERLGQSRKGKEIAKAIEADSYYESKLNS